MPTHLPRKIRESFSAKIIALVVSSVLLTSLVVGLVTTNTSRKFLIEKATGKFPSTLTNTHSKIRNWYNRHSRDIGELCASTVFRDNLARYTELTNSDEDAEREREALNRYMFLVHEKFPVYKDILLVSPDGTPVAASSPFDELSDELRLAAELIRETGQVEAFARADLKTDRLSVYHWLLVPIHGEEGGHLGWVAVEVDLENLAAFIGDIPVGPGGDMFILDAQGRFLTQPRRVHENMLRQRAMQVPTRQDGPLLVEIRKNYRGERVFHSKIHLVEHGWWLVYEDDYSLAIAPVISAQRQIWVAVVIIGILAVVAALRVVRSILQPIRSLALGAKRINEGLVGVKIPRASNDEVGMLTDTFNEMAKTITLSKAELQYKNKMLNSQNDQLQDMNTRLETLSVTDGLTGLYNHRHFWNILDRELARVNRYQGDLALILVDLDDFKRVNDQFGHSVGDLLLQSIARIMKETVRDTDIVARYGGEEFAVLLPETDRKGVESVAEKLRASVEEMRFSVPDTDITLRVTVSIGISVFRGNRREFFNSADKALYQSKAAGKNRINFAVA